MSLFITEHTPNFSTAGQITSENISEIANLGYRTIIGNRPDLEGGSEQPMQADIEKAALAVGLHFAYLPVISGQITRDQVLEMAALLEELPKPVLAYCRSGARSANLFHLTQQLSG